MSEGSSLLTALNLEAYESERGVALYGGERGLSSMETVLVDAFFPKPPARVLDIGCGAGRTTIALAERGYEVVAVDLSPNLLGLARRRFPNLSFLRTDACKLSFSDSSFEAALFSYNGIDCIFPVSERLRCLSEAHRILRPGGVFLLSSHNYIGSVFSGGFFYPRGYWNALHTLWQQRRNRYWKQWYLFYPDEQQYLYSAPPGRTRRQLEEAGFSVGAVRGFRNEMSARKVLFHHQHVHFIGLKRPEGFP